MEAKKRILEAIQNGTAEVLALCNVNALIGKKIITIYFGYRGQDGVDEFVVGEVKNEIYANGKKGPLCIFTADGRNTHIRADEKNEGVFYCSDIDRYVHYIVVE